MKGQVVGTSSEVFCGEITAAGRVNGGSKLAGLYCSAFFPCQKSTDTEP